MNENDENLLVDLFKDFITLYKIAKGDDEEKNEENLVGFQKLFTKLSNETNEPKKFIEKLNNIDVSTLK